MWEASAKATHIFSVEVLAYIPYLMLKASLVLNNLALNMISGHSFLNLFKEKNTIQKYKSRNVRKRTFEYARQAKIKISLRICAVWFESSPGAFSIAQDTKIVFHADNEDFGKNARMRRLISVFIWRKCQMVRFSHVDWYQS